MKNIFKSEWFWFALLSLTMLTVAFIPFFYYISVTPKGSIFYLLHNNLFDFPMFVSVIRQAQEGHLTQVQRLTSEPQFGTWVHMFYLVVGWITGPLRIEPAIAYHLSRFVTGFLLMYVFYLFIRLFFKDKITRIAVFFLTVFAGGFPNIKYDHKFYLIEWPFMGFFTGFDVVRRAAFLPHGMMRDVLFLAIIIFWIKLLETKRRIFLWLTVFCGFFLGFHSPIHSLFIYAITGLLCGILLLKDLAAKSGFKTSAGNILGYIVYVLLTIPSSIYLYWVFENSPWKVVKEWEAPQHPIFPLSEYAMGVGPLFFMSIPTILFFLVKFINFLISNVISFVNRKPLADCGFNFVKYYFLIIVVAVTLPFLFTYFGNSIGLTNFRFLGVPLQVFFGVSGGMFLVSLAKMVNGKNIAGYHQLLVFLSLLIFIIISPTYIVSYSMQFKENMPPIAFNIYPRLTYFEGLKWLRNNTERDDIVLSDMATGNWIPAYAGNTVYLGHPVSTIEAPRKKEEVVTFYKTQVTAETAYRFLKDKNIKYVIWSYDEWAYGGNPDKYGGFLQLMFGNADMRIYKVM